MLSLQPTQNETTVAVDPCVQHQLADRSSPNYGCHTLISSIVVAAGRPRLYSSPRPLITIITCRSRSFIMLPTLVHTVLFVALAIRHVTASMQIDTPTLIQVKSCSLFENWLSDVHHHSAKTLQSTIQEEIRTMVSISFPARILVQTQCKLSTHRYGTRFCL